MKIRKAVIPIFEVILFLIIVVIAINNTINNEDFFDATITQILTLLVAIGIAFIATQRKNDQRKAKEHAERLLMKLQQIVIDEQFYTISADFDGEELKKLISSTNRKISNYISILKSYGESLCFKKEIEYIEEEFKKYKEKTGDHINDPEYLSKTESEFRKIAENIDTKCELIIHLFYK